MSDGLPRPPTPPAPSPATPPLPDFLTLSPAQLRAECERIWQRPGVAFPHNKAGWRYAWRGSRGGFILDYDQQNYLVPWKGAAYRWTLRFRNPGARLLKRLWGR